MSAENALTTFELEPGFKIELLAAEPLIGDPVDMEIDEYGRLYVVEMPGYPLDKSGTGKIKLLSDSNGDGRMDKSTVFAEGLMLPNSIMRWKKGLLVTDAPNVLYMEDNDGDGRAETIDTLLTGFALSNPQHNLNSPLLGIDNWIYLAHEGAVSTETYEEEFGDKGHEIYYPDHPQSPRLGVNADGRSVRFRPDQYRLETTSSNTQFGHTFDAWGHHLLVQNYNHVLHEVLPAIYIMRNPGHLISVATQSLSDHGNAAEVFPITINPQHQLLTDVGVITSACGIISYQGGSFPSPFNNDVTFVAEPVSNIIHVDKLSHQGASFMASRIHPHREFLASTDAKFRPVNMYIGPDGALYIVDYYREIIEHPEWMGEEVIKSGKLYNDMDKGRIYRISATDAKPVEWTKGISLGEASDENLVEKLSSENVWWRQNAQRLLIDRANKETVPLLIKMTENTNSPVGRLHALWTLQGLGELNSTLITRALQDPVSGVRENAIKLAELYLVNDPQLVTALVSLQNDPDAKVRFQLLCTLGFIDTPEVSNVRKTILFNDINDKWVQIGALTVSFFQTKALFKNILDSFRADVPAYGSLVQQISTMLGAGENPQITRELIRKAIPKNSKDQPEWQAFVIEGLAKGMQTKKLNPSVFAPEQHLLIKTFFEHPSAQMRTACLRMLEIVDINDEAKAVASIKKALIIATDKQQTDYKRAEAIDFLSLRDPIRHADILTELLFAPDEALSVRLAALRTLSKIHGTTVSNHILQNWSALTPEIRDAAVNFLLVNKERIAMLLNALEEDKIQTTNVAWPRQVRLMAQSDEKLRNRARAIFTRNDDKEINKSYQRSLELKGNEENGIVIYQKNCARCHQIREEMGVVLGPDLGTIHNWSPDAIMTNILAPNSSISSGYDLWAVELKNGESIQGIISSETPGAITLRNADSMEKTINRQDIKSLKALNMSIMPGNWENQISYQEMADLLAFLKQNR